MENVRCPVTNNNVQNQPQPQPQQQQQHLQEVIEPFYGDIPGPCPDDCFRLLGCNIAGYPLDDKNDSKSANLFAGIRKYEVDIACLQEMGNNWSNQPHRLKWRSRVEKELDMSQTRTVCSHNLRDKTGTRHQWGGTAILSHGKISHYSMGTGNDDKKLGRWVWARYRGKGNNVLRVICFYRPNKGNSGELTVHAQHKEYLQSINDDRDPRKAFLEDFDGALAEYIDSGDHLIITGDMNQHILHADIMELFDKHHISNLIFRRHSPDNCPATFIRNQNGDILDGMWATPGVEARRCGLLEPGSIPSDHWNPWADITYTSVLGHDPPLPQTPAARRLKLQDSKATKKYIRLLWNYIEDHQLRRRQFQLEASVIPGVPLSLQQAREANAIDVIRTHCMLQAEKQCRKLRMGGVEFSEATNLPRKRIDFWHTAISRRKGTSISSRLWSRKKHAARITTSTRHLSLADLFLQLREAKRDYRTESNNAADSRVKFLDTFSEKDRNRIKRVEAQRKLGRAAKWISGTSNSKRVTSVIANGREHCTKETIETALLPINESKYRASESTPFMQEPLRSEFGYSGHSDHVDAVLNGTYEPPDGTDDYSRLLLQTMQVPDQVRVSKFPMSIGISTDEHIRAWNRAKERTSSGKSGLHFGMFKANVRDRRIAELDASMRSVAYATGHIYDRWRTGIDVQILKQSRDFRAEKLRTILQLEADFNMNNKKVNRDLSWKAERDKSLARDNYGGRKHLRASEVSMNQQLAYNSIWGRRGRAIVLSNDARGCYDRMAHMIAYICLLRLGGVKATLLGIIDAIQTMRHYIRTAFGDSDASYGNDPDKPPLQGLLQGNGMAGLGWSSIGTVLMEAMKSEGFGYEAWSLISQRAISLVCFAFVDDTDLIHSNNDPAVSSEDLIHEAQTVLHTWEGLLRSSGGALAPEKSYWYLVEVIRQNGAWTYRKQVDAPGQIHLHNNGDPALAERLDVTDSRKALGIHTRPDGNMSNQVDHLRNKAIAWADSIRTKRPPKHVVWYSLNNCILKTIEYPLMATTFSRKQIDRIMAPILTAALPLCGIQKNMPRKLVYGTLRAQGCNIQDPWAVQLIEHLQAILRHGNRDTPSRDLHVDNMEIIQTHLGSSTPFWDLPFRNYGVLAPKGWMKNTWEALSSTSLQLKGPCHTLPPQREHDQHLMDVFVHANYSDDELLILNNCRLYLQVTRLSDIGSAQGDGIDLQFWIGSPIPRRLNQQHRWPKAYPPSRNEWAIWQSKLRECFLVPLAAHQRLLRPLGNWLTDNDNEWIWWFSPSQNTIWEKSAAAWRTWQPNPQHALRRPSFHLPHDSLLHAQPTDLRRASVSHIANGISMSSYSALGFPMPTVDSSSLPSILRNLPNDAHWAVRHVLFDDDGRSMAEAFRNGTATAVSDGSLKLELGTAAFVLEGSDQSHRIQGVNQVPGPIKEGDSYRCELAGIYSVILIADSIAKLHKVDHGTATIACDNISSLRIFEPDFSPDPSRDSFDIINAICSILQTTPIVWKAQHVKGHQDNDRYRILTRLEQLNVEMDTLAKRYWLHLFLQNEIPPIPIHHTIHREGWSLWDGNRKIPRANRKNLYAAIQEPITTMFWIRHGRFTPDDVSNIDWDCCDRGMQSLSAEGRHWITKHASENCGIGTTLVKWKFQDDDHCPRCNQKEDSTHIFQCHGEGADAIWQDNIHKLTTFLVENLTHPELQDALLLRLHQWRHALPYSPVPDPEVQQVLQQQDRIGWKNFLEGLPATQWKQLQQRHYNGIESRRTGRRWMSLLLKKLNTVGRAMWKHRNDIKHFNLRPRHQEEERRLNEEISDEMNLGPTDLPPDDHHHFEHILLELLQKSLAYRKAWLINVSTARLRQERKRTRDEELVQASRKRSKLLQWILTNRAS